MLLSSRRRGYSQLLPLKCCPQTTYQWWDWWWTRHTVHITSRVWVLYWPRTCWQKHRVSIIRWLTGSWTPSLWSTPAMEVVESEGDVAAEPTATDVAWHSLIPVQSTDSVTSFVRLLTGTSALLEALKENFCSSHDPRAPHAGVLVWRRLWRQRPERRPLACGHHGCECTRLLEPW
jgi:hypothetical protein